MTGLEAGFRLADAEVRPMEGLVIGAAGRVRIEPKSMAVLVELARHAGDVCSREQIQQKVWPRGFTTDDVLTRCIGQIRRALGDDPKNPTYLETLPRRGYRLLQAATKMAAPPTTAEPAEPQDKLIVLPFQYLSSDNRDYVADGITELLTARLATLREIRVLSRTTAMQYKLRPASIVTIAEQTGAHWAVEGSVLHAGDLVQVVVQLIDARTDAHVWAQDYLRDLGDILLLQNEIVREIATAIRLKVGAAPQLSTSPVSLPANVMRAYLLGRQMLSRRTPDTLHQAIEQFSTVCKSSPEFASAWASRAEAHLMLCHYGAMDPGKALNQCNDDLDRALTLDPDLPIGLSCRAGMRFMADRNYDSAESDLRRALKLQPDYSIAMLLLANILAVQQRFDEAQHWLEQALIIDPLDVGINMNIGDHLILQRRFEDAVAALEKALELEPGHRPSLLRLAWAQSLSARHDAALATLATAGPTDEQDWQWREYAAMCAGLRPDHGAAREAYGTMQEIAAKSFVPPWSLARAAAACGDADACLQWLQEAKQLRSTSLPFAAVTPALDAVRDHPAFRTLLT